METQNNIMNIYDDFPVEINENSSTKDLLDYMMLVLVRSIDTNEAFKGGYLLSKILSGESRLTKDIDFSIMNKEYYEPIKEVLISIGEVFKIKGIVTDYKVKEEIKEGWEGSIRYRYRITRYFIWNAKLRLRVRFSSRVFCREDVI